jgi:hypothetical protein
VPSVIDFTFGGTHDFDGCLVMQPFYAISQVMVYFADAVHFCLFLLRVMMGWEAGYHLNSFLLWEGGCVGLGAYSGSTYSGKHFCLFSPPGMLLGLPGYLDICCTVWEVVPLLPPAGGCLSCTGLYSPATSAYTAPGGACYCLWPDLFF